MHGGMQRNRTYAQRTPLVGWLSGGPYLELASQCQYVLKCYRCAVWFAVCSARGSRHGTRSGQEHTLGSLAAPLPADSHRYMTPVHVAVCVQVQWASLP